MTTPRELRAVQEATWNGSLPLEIRLSSSDSRVYDQTDPYLVYIIFLGMAPVLLLRHLSDPLSTAVLFAFLAP